MKAVIINEFGGPEQLIYTDVAKPTPRDNEILVRNEIIGVGKPDYLMRSGNDPYLEDKLPGARPTDASVVPDGAFITARAAGSAFDFGLELVKVLAGGEKAEEVRHNVHYR